jgi:hypothetical protein
VNKRLNKTLGILQSANLPIRITENDRGFMQILSDDKLLLVITAKEFDQLTVHEILEKAGVDIR